jgi:hypothetical protein
VQTAERFEELVDSMPGYLRAGVTYTESTGCGDLDVDHAVRSVVPDRVVYQVGGKPVQQDRVTIDDSRLGVLPDHNSAM